MTCPIAFTFALREASIEALADPQVATYGAFIVARTYRLDARIGHGSAAAT